MEEEMCTTRIFSFFFEQVTEEHWPSRDLEVISQELYVNTYFYKS